jgi:DNA-binding NarL/FixJ family response regulator
MLAERPVSVLIVEDEPEFLRRFVDAVSADPALSLVGAVSSGSEAKALLEQYEPDVMLVDLGLPDMNGVEVIRHAARTRPGTDILVVTMFGDDEHVMRSINAGATGYLLKDAMPDRISASIRELHEGGAPITPSIARRVLASFRNSNSTVREAGGGERPPSAAEPSPLSAREVDILRLVAKGMSFNEVGETLSISPHTVVSHVKNIYRKLAVHSRGEAVFEAGQLGLL